MDLCIYGPLLGSHLHHANVQQCNTSQCLSHHSHSPTKLWLANSLSVFYLDLFQACCDATCVCVVPDKGPLNWCVCVCCSRRKPLGIRGTSYIRCISPATNHQRPSTETYTDPDQWAHPRFDQTAEKVAWLPLSLRSLFDFSTVGRVSRYQKGKTNLDFTEARDSEWQWHQLGHMQVCTSLQTDNHASTSPLSFLQAGCPSCRPTNSVKALKASTYIHTSLYSAKNREQRIWGADRGWLDGKVVLSR